MKTWITPLAFVLGLLWIASSLAPKTNPGQFDVIGFSQLPVLANGRLKPIDTLARTSLLQLQARQTVYLDQALSTPQENGKELTPEEWILDVAFRQDVADTYTIFAIDNPEILGSILKKTDDDLAIKYPDKTRQILAVMDFLPNRRRRFSYKELDPFLNDIDQQAKLADQVDASQRSHFQNAVLDLYHNLVQYQQLKYAFTLPAVDDPLSQLFDFQKSLPAGIEAVRAKEAKKPFDRNAADTMISMGNTFFEMDGRTNIFAIPPPSSSTDISQWKSTGKALIGSFQTGTVDSAALVYAGFAVSWQKGDYEHFNKLVGYYRAALEKQLGPSLKKTDAEVRFNAAEPFYTATVIYATAFFLAIGSWLMWPRLLSRSAAALVACSWLLATAGILTRMWLEGRPPVTNLYSSALFVGWGAVLLCLVLEAIFRNAIASAAAGMIGFSTLLIAHQLSLSGDTLEMMRAVLDSNFWLATHVVVVTTGYASTFLAGFLAILYVLRGLFTKSLDEATALALGKMVYGIVCFATLFSFIGTVLGGIWADQSWGRFWGWDPKENGALIIVIWNALILHARWGGMVRTRGLIALAIAGNIVTAWSWFGTNMLGVGLHSYGFTEAAFQWLVGFVASQLLLIGLALVPRERWRSFAGTSAVAKAKPSAVGQP